MELKQKKIIIDCDPGIDDAFALAYASKQRNAEIIGITTVAGNVPLCKTTENALTIGDMFVRVPVYKGAEKPLSDFIHLSIGNDFHGRDGLGDIGLKPSERKAEDENAVDFILKTLSKSEDQAISIICLGPLTNIALAIQKDPQCMKRAGAIYSMGGSVLYGNASPVAEFNYWSDPMAAKIVYGSGMPIHMIGLNVCDTVAMPADLRNRMKLADPEASFLHKMLDTLESSIGAPESDGIVLYDLIAMIASLTPDIVKWLHCSVDISTTKVTRGECIADLEDAWKKDKNCFYAAEINKQQLWEMFCNTLLPV